MGGVGFADSSAPDFVAAAFTSRVAAFGCLLPSLTVTGVGAARDSALVSLLAASTPVRSTPLLLSCSFPLLPLLPPLPSPQPPPLPLICVPVEMVPPPHCRPLSSGTAAICTRFGKIGEGSALFFGGSSSFAAATAAVAAAVSTTAVSAAGAAVISVLVGSPIEVGAAEVELSSSPLLFFFSSYLVTYMDGHTHHRKK